MLKCLKNTNTLNRKIAVQNKKQMELDKNTRSENFKK